MGEPDQSSFLNQLKNSIFVDFLNTFLNLPVFGQIPLYVFKDKQWELQPDLPSKSRNVDGLMNWLEDYRLPYFLQTDLYLHFVLCESLLDVTVQEIMESTALPQDSANMSLNLQFSDETLSSESAGSNVDVTKSESVKDPAKGVVKDVPSLRLEGSHRTRRDFLEMLHKRVLQKLRTYWLPRFLAHCKQSLKKLKECAPILRRYQAMVSQGKVTRELSAPAELSMGIKRTEGPTLPYFTKANKRFLWGIPYCLGTQPPITVTGPVHPVELKAEAKRQCPQRKPRALKPSAPRTPQSVAPRCRCQAPDWASCLMAVKPHTGVDPPHVSEEYIFPQLDSSLPLIKAPSMLTFWRFSEVPPQARYLHWAFNADQAAGGPFAAFLKLSHNSSKLHYLRLWHDLSCFFNVVLSTKDRAGFVLRAILAEKIVEVYLKEDSAQYTQLQPETAHNLKLALPSGWVLAWILTAQREICEILRDTYDAFLDEDDQRFLHLVAGTKPSDPNAWTQCEKSPLPPDDTYIRRMAQSLLLAQACSALGDTETLTDEDWKLVAREDITSLGSMQIFRGLEVKETDIKDMTFQELARKFPKLAIEELSKYFMQYYKKLVLLGLINREAIQDKLWTKLNLKYIKDGNQIITRPKTIPRNLMDLLMNPMAVLFFQRFLEAYDADAPLRFWQAVEDLHSLHTEKQRQRGIKWILNNFFNPNLSAEQFLQCEASIIKQIMAMIKSGEQVTMNMLLQAQSDVQNSLQQNWFDLYLKTYPKQPLEYSPSLTILRSIQTISRKNRSWKELEALIRSIVTFRRMMRIPQLRLCFIHFLRDEVYNNEHNNLASRTMTRVPSQGSSFVLRGADYVDDSDTPHLKRRMMFNRQLIVNYLVNDLHFCMEIEHYVKRAEAAIVMARVGLHDEIYEGLLRAKVEMIIRLFLHADTLPRLRVNITDYEKDRVIMSSRHGKLEPDLFHQARMTIILPLLYFWRRFCVMNAWRIFGKPRPPWKKESSSPNYLYPSLQYMLSDLVPQYTSEEFPTLRFSLSKGIQLLIPQEKDETQTAEQEQNAVQESQISQKAKSLTSNKVSISSQSHLPGSRPRLSSMLSPSRISYLSVK
ncbi:regulator of G-protein signaling protein-like isoform X2 [Chiloscyllium plagiosum]|uniref:regulator of G-protein signaling protein-like isoform X2 n=1 Tax=Chiloscyllium plagiosum TaxID=36176 RepID=UPI001CB84690|nr:regulator of G-protein signaling protein-like isoform X2 [Chiloscyllium plagiosum]